MTLLVSDTASAALLHFTYTPLWVALSCLIAICGSALALYTVAFRTKIQSRPTRQAILWLGATAFGLAVWSTFLIVQAETQDTMPPRDAQYLTIMVAIAVAAILGLTAASVLLTRLQDSLTALKVQGYELEAITEHAAQGVVTILADGKIKSINRTFENIFECTTEDVVSQPVTAFIPEWPKLLEQTARHMAFETMGKRKDGSEFPIEIKLTRLESGLLAYDVGFIQDVSDTQALQNKLRHDAHYDFLTGLHNKRFVEEQLAIEFSRSDRSGTPLSLLLLDIDHFKAINGAFGHIACDKVLAAVASMLRMNSRNGDILSRYGGEEFLLLLPNTDLASAMQVAERIRSETANLALSSAGKTIRFTVSLGVTCLQSTFALTPKDLLRQADMALYRAKRAGRNRVEFEVSGRKASHGSAQAHADLSNVAAASGHRPEETPLHA